MNLSIGNNLIIHIAPFYKLIQPPEYLENLDFGQTNIFLYIDHSSAPFQKVSSRVYRVGLSRVSNGFPICFNKIDKVLTDDNFIIEREICLTISKVVKKEFPKRSKAISVDVLINNINVMREEEIRHSAPLQNFINFCKPFMGSSSYNGAIVMNCNPFTNGHFHLIEYASRKVEKLFIFVVEEDKSYFKFKDRLRLVQEGCATLENVIVLPSSRFIISTATFPDYFDKEDKNAPTHFDASLDLEFFCKYIAPPLNIKTRFFGSEPNCLTTGAYNKQAMEIFPKHDIKVEIVPRLEIDGEAVSASMVRKYIKRGEFDKIIKLVPPVTWKFIKDQIVRGRIKT